MTGLMILVLFSMIVTLASNLMKRFLRNYIKNPNIKFGMAIALIFGLVLSLSWGKGVVAYLGELSYTDALYPTLFMYVDLALTGILYAGSSKIFTDMFEELNLLRKPPGGGLNEMPSRPETVTAKNREYPGCDTE